MSVQSYQSKIIHPLEGPFPTVHDYFRLDLDENDHTFKWHRYYIQDGGGRQYTRKFGMYEINEGKIVLKYQKSGNLPCELDEEIDFYERFKDEENIYDVEKMLNNVIGLYLSFEDQDLEYDDPYESKTEIYTYKEEYGHLEIKTNEKPFGGNSIYKKIQPWHICDWETTEMPSAFDCGIVINYFCEQGKLEKAKRYFDKYFELMEKEYPEQLKESLQSIFEKEFDYEFAKKYTKYTRTLYKNSGT